MSAKHENTSCISVNLSLSQIIKIIGKFNLLSNCFVFEFVSGMENPWDNRHWPCTALLWKCRNGKPE